MTKSRHSAIKLRLSRLALCLVAIGCVKLCLMGLAAWTPLFGGAAQQEARPVAEDNVQAKLDELAAKMNIDRPQAESFAESGQTTKNVEPLPQGTLAAQLAGAAKPRRPAPSSSSPLPAPLVPVGSTAVSHASPAFQGELPPMPGPLGAPLVPAGIPAPRAQAQTAVPREDDGLWDMFKLTSLPIPGLGSVKAVHAAALDMPAPPPLQQASPFTPAEQLAPMGTPGVTLPGAPEIPAGIASGTAGGAPLAPRAPAVMPQAASDALATAPSPDIGSLPQRFDPNAQSSELARQQQDILMLRRQMDDRLKDIQAAEDKMKDLLREANELEDKKVRNLVQMYANMKPRTAAQALENMDERIAVRILSGMPPKQSGEILTYTNPATTAKLTELITRMKMGNQ